MRPFGVWREEFRLIVLMNAVKGDFSLNSLYICFDKKPEMLRFLFVSITSLAILLTVVAPVVPNLLTVADVEYVMADSGGKTNQNSSITIIEEEDKSFQLGLPEPPDLSPQKRNRLPYHLIPLPWCPDRIHLPPPEQVA